MPQNIVQRQFWDADVQSTAIWCSRESLEQAGHRPSLPLSAVAQTKGSTEGKNPGEQLFLKNLLEGNQNFKTPSDEIGGRQHSAMDHGMELKISAF